MNTACRIKSGAVRRRKAHFAMLILPAGIWIWGGKVMLRFARAIAQTGIAPRQAILRSIWCSGRLSRIGFLVWREREGKWR